MHPLVTLSVRPSSRDVGLAETRYRTPEEMARRHEVATAMRHIASLNESSWILKGYEEIDRKRLAIRRQADRFEVCSAQYCMVRCRDCKRPIIGPQRCELRICESCSRKYAATIRKRMEDVIRDLKPEKGKRLAFLTLTRKTHPLYRPTTSEVKHTFNCARKLINGFWPKKDGGGAFATFETGDNENIHIHALIYGRYVPQREISRRWLKLTGDSYVVHIRSAYNARKGVGYLLKYVTKPKKTEDPLDLAYYQYLLIGIRRIHTYGVFYNHIRLRPATGCPCPACGGKLRLFEFTPGPMVPGDAIFWKEAPATGKARLN